MTEEQLREIEARAAAATPGPWHPLPSHASAFENPVTGELVSTVVALAVCDTDGDPVQNGGAEGTPNAVFIAHAREDVPALIAEVRRLMKALEEADDAISGLHARMDRMRNVPNDSCTLD